MSKVSPNPIMDVGAATSAAMNGLMSVVASDFPIGRRHDRPPHVFGMPLP